MEPYAIVCAVGKEHRVAVGQRLRLDRIAGEVGAEITWDKVLLLGGGQHAVRIGQPVVGGATVTARIVAHMRGDKVRVFKRRKRKGFHKTIGHRQALTELEITGIAG